MADTLEFNEIYQEVKGSMVRDARSLESHAFQGVGSTESGKVSLLWLVEWCV